MDSTSLVPSPRIQVDDDQLDGFPDDICGARAITYDSIFALTDLVTMPIGTRGSAWWRDRTDRNNLVGIRQPWPGFSRDGRIAYHRLPPYRFVPICLSDQLDADR